MKEEKAAEGTHEEEEMKESEKAAVTTEDMKPAEVNILGALG